MARNFVRKKSDVAKTAFFFIGSYFITAIYAFYQVFADKFGLKSFEAMFGRPNSTFAEPDWLGVYLVFALAVLLTLIFYFSCSKQAHPILKKYALMVLDLLVFSNIILVILTLSRSAWIGAAAIIVFYLIALIPARKALNTRKKVGEWKLFLREAAVIISMLAISLAAVHFAKLSKFDIFDRARSAATNEQKITIACAPGANIPEIISSANELEKFGCRHINLEEIGSYRSQGKTVTEIFRKDPNVMTRGMIYQKSWEILRAHPILGVGYGTITQALGTDERGSGLNESNIFLQIWAGSGIMGLLAFVGIFGYLFIYALRRVSPVCPINKIIGCPVVEDDFEKTLNVFAVLGILAIIIPNLFNAGLLMGMFWLGLAIFASIKYLRG